MYYQQQVRVAGHRPRGDWYERRPVIAVTLVMVLFGLSGLALSGLLVLCALLLVPFT